MKPSRCVGACFLLWMFGCFTCSLTAFSQAVPNAKQTAVPQAGEHDFDFNIGAWKTRIMYLEHPLAGSTAWDEIDGTLVVRKIWDGRGQIEEFEADGSERGYETLLLRVYNPQSRQWSFIFANSGGGTICSHMVGEFKNGRGEFIDRELFNGKPVLVRTIWSNITPTSHRYEIAFSDDGGRKWESNFIAALTREKQGKQ